MTDTAALVPPARLPEKEQPVRLVAAPPAQHTEATRLLAAAAYHDGGYRRKVLHEIQDQPFRAFSPELGIDRRTILAHCVAGQRRERWRDAALLLCWLPLVAGGFLVNLVSYPEELPLVIEYHAAALLSTIGLGFAVALAGTLLTHHFTLARRFSRARFAASGEAPPSTERQNVVVYGGFSPFIGAGLDLGGWSFTVNLERGKPGLGDETRPDGFDIADLYRAVEEAVARLEFDGLRMDDRLFVDGRSVRDDRRFLPRMFKRPVTTIDRSVVEQYRGHPAQAVRHYLCIEITDWDGEIVLSTFLRFQKSASKLFVEASYFFVPPLKAKYYELDARDPRLTLAKLREWLIRSVVATAIYLPIAPIRVAALAFRPLNRLLVRRGLKKAVRANPRYNYGATVSLRELGTDNAYRVYFQKLDKEMHLKFVQQQILDVLVGFLDAHGVDTSDLRDRGSTIMNNGVIVSGGTIKAEALAVGAGAKAGSSRQGGGTFGKLRHAARRAA
jgi:hypothetical protein